MASTLSGTVAAPQYDVQQPQRIAIRTSDTVDDIAAAVRLAVGIPRNDRVGQRRSDSSGDVHSLELAYQAAPGMVAQGTGVRLTFL